MGAVQQTLGLNTVGRLSAYLLGYWPCHDASGGAVDVSGNGNDLTLAGSATFEASGLAGTCIDLTDGNASALYLSDVDAVPTLEWTIGGWFKSDSRGTTSAHFFEFGVSSADRALLFNSSNVSWAPRMRDGGTTYTPPSVAIDAQDASWHLVIFARQGDQMGYMIDGTWLGEVNHTRGSSHDWNYLAFGGSIVFPAGGNAWDGQLQHLFAYDKWIGRPAAVGLYNGGTPIDPRTGRLAI